MNDKNVSLIDLFFVMHIHWGQTLYAFENQHHSSLNMRNFAQFSDFLILVIPEAIFQAGAVKFGSVGRLDILINISSGFCYNKKNLFLLNTWCIF